MKTEENSAPPVAADLALLGDVLIQIRAIAGSHTGELHGSRWSDRYMTPKAALEGIYALSDAAHNIPQALADGPDEGAHFLLDGARVRVLQVLHPDDRGDEVQA